jgi:hypothetical protein
MFIAHAAALTIVVIGVVARPPRIMNQFAPGIHPGYLMCHTRQSLLSFIPMDPSERPSCASSRYNGKLKARFSCMLNSIPIEYDCIVAGRGLFHTTWSCNVTSAGDINITFREDEGVGYWVDTSVYPANNPNTCMNNPIASNTTTAIYKCAIPLPQPRKRQISPDSILFACDIVPPFSCVLYKDGDVTVLLQHTAYPHDSSPSTNS